MQIKQAVQLSNQLRGVSESAQLDVELMLCHLLDKPGSYLFTWPEKELDPKVVDQLKVMVDRRLKGEPVAHIIGMRGFWNFDLEVSSHTLIPRPDTEVVVEKALQLCTKKHARITDLGTGTGAIALALAYENPEWTVVASDFVPEAAQLAERNRARLQLENVEVIQGSWFEAHQGYYDMIVSNPPYIDPEDPHLEQGDVRFEPLSALTAEDHGMADIKHICEQARSYLVPGGHLLFEHGYDQGPVCRALLESLGYTEIGTQRDYGDNERVTFALWPGEPCA